MSCPQCQTDLPAATKFCPGCGSPGEAATETRAFDLHEAPSAEPGSAGRADPYPVEAGSSDTGRPAGATTVLAAPPVSAPAGPSIGERIAPAADVARDQARHWADRFGHAPAEVRVAIGGAVVTVLSFLLLPYVAGSGAAVELSGRYWWRPIAAVAATVLLAASLGRVAHAKAGGAEVPRHTDGLLAAVVVAAAGVTEAGLLGLLAGDVARPRAGFYGMLIGLLAVLVAAVRAARRTLR